MTQVECHGCERRIEESEARWVRPFEGGISTEGLVMQTSSKIREKPVPGAVPYCPTCLATLVASASK